MNSLTKRTWLDKLDDLLKANLLHLRSNFERLRKGLAKCRDYIFNFLENPAIPPDNNASERNPKTEDKAESVRHFQV